jgi:hypothetical protein
VDVLERRGILKPVLRQSARGASDNHYLPSQLAPIKKCLDTARGLMRDGKVKPSSAGFIDGLVSHPGFCAQLSAVGWMRIDDGGIALPNFDRHNGGGAKTRALTARRNETLRAKKSERHQSDAPRDAAPSYAASPEERREDKKTKDQNTPQGMLPFAFAEPTASHEADQATALAQEFAFIGGEGTSASATQQARAAVIDILDAGLTVDAIRAESNRPGRQRSEHPGRMRDRLIPQKKEAKNGRQPDAGDFDPNRTDYPSPRDGRDAAG